MNSKWLQIKIKESKMGCEGTIYNVPFLLWLPGEEGRSTELTPHCILEAKM